MPRLPQAKSGLSKRDLDRVQANSPFRGRPKHWGEPIQEPMDDRRRPCRAPMKQSPVWTLRGHPKTFDKMSPEYIGLNRPGVVFSQAPNQAVEIAHQSILVGVPPAPINRAVWAVFAIDNVVHRAPMAEFFVVHPFDLCCSVQWSGNPTQLGRIDALAQDSANRFSVFALFVIHPAFEKQTRRQQDRAQTECSRRKYPTRAHRHAS